MTKFGTLFLIPSIISPETQDKVIPSQVKNVLPGLKYFLVENIRTARRYLSSLKIFESIEPLHFETLDKKTSMGALDQIMAPLLSGNDMGVISESGCPGVADPGALAAKWAHKKGIRVIPLVGPSSILLALMSSGLSGQNFSFHGYLPIKQNELQSLIKRLEVESIQKNQTQIFIETPYRNNSLFKNLISSLKNNTLLCVALDLTGHQESIKTLAVLDWKSQLITLPKVPAIFLFLAEK